MVLSDDFAWRLDYAFCFKGAIRDKKLKITTTRLNGDVWYNEDTITPLTGSEKRLYLFLDAANEYE